MIGSGPCGLGLILWSLLCTVAQTHGGIQVDDYLDLCAQSGTEPEKAYKGSFNVRLSAEMHKQAAVYAMEHGISLNNLVEKAVQSLLMREQSLA